MKSKLIRGLAKVCIGTVLSLCGLVLTVGAKESSTDRPSALSEKKALIDRLEEETDPAIDDCSDGLELVVDDSGLLEEKQIGQIEGKTLQELYAKRVLGLDLGDQELLVRGSLPYDRLTEREKKAYDILKNRIEEVARSGGSTEFYVGLDLLGIESEDDIQQFLEDEGIEMYKYSPEKFNDLVKDRYYVDMIHVYYALLNDMPYESYWRGGSYLYRSYYSLKSYGLDSDTHTVAEVYSLNLPAIFIKVSPDYSDGSDFSVRSDVSRVTDARDRALQIVEEAQDLKDYEKLSHYKDSICSLTSYEYDDKNYGDVWQLISVFDGDPKTRTRCEGYARAFKYLCDCTDFNADLSCITVAGSMEGEPHMWNIVGIRGSNYMVDVTNSDWGTSGFFGGLFMTGAKSGSPRDGYVYEVLDSELEYTYTQGDDLAGTAIDQLLLYGEEALTISDRAYDPSWEETPRAKKGRSSHSGPSTPAWLIGAPAGVRDLLLSYEAAGRDPALLRTVDSKLKDAAMEYSYPFFQDYLAQSLAQEKEGGATSQPGLESSIGSGEEPWNLLPGIYRSGDRVYIRTDKWLSLDKKALEAIEACPLEVVIIYKATSEGIEVTIPADYPAGDLADPQGYAGLMYIKKRLEAGN